MNPKAARAIDLALEALDGLYLPGELARVNKAITAIKEALVQTEQEPVVLAQEVIGCFHAAEIEGLTAALVNTSDLHLKDLVERRLMYALYAAQEIGCTNESLKEKNT